MMQWAKHGQNRSRLTPDALAIQKFKKVADNLQVWRAVCNKFQEGAPKKKIFSWIAYQRITCRIVQLLQIQ